MGFFKKNSWLLAVFIAFNSINVLHSQQNIPGDITIQGKLSNSAPILGVNANILRDQTTVQVLIIDLLPDENGVFTAVLQNIDKNIFSAGSSFSIIFSSSTGEMLGVSELNGVPFAFRAQSAVLADSAITLSENPVISGILTADYLQANSSVRVESWKASPKVDETDYPLIIERLNQKGEARIKSKLSLQGNLAYRSGWYSIPERIPELKWILGDSNNYFKWRIQPVLTQVTPGSPGNPPTFKLSDIRLDLDSSFLNPDTGIVTPAESIITITKNGDMDVSGNKHFVHQHPGDSNKQIFYTSLEGPESNTFVRGNAWLSSGTAIVELPEHFNMVTSQEVELSVLVTPLEDCNGLYVADKSTSRIEIKELNGGISNVKFSYFVLGVRKGFENTLVIREKPANISTDELY